MFKAVNTPAMYVSIRGILSPYLSTTRIAIDASDSVSRSVQTSEGKYKLT